MNVSELIQSHFGTASAERLGREVGLSATDAERVLRAGLPLQLGALADHARTSEGQANIGEALASLPAFATVEDALGSPEAAGQLGQAGALLAPALLGEQESHIAGQVAGGLDRGRVERLLHLTLPLLLSFLGQRGLTAANAGSFMVGQGGSSSTGGQQTGDVQVFTAGGAAVAATTGAGTVGGPLTSDGLINFLKGQFGGGTADRLGRAAGFSGGTAARATLAALPLVLHAVASKGSTPEGTADLLRRSRDFERLTDTGGGLNAALLADAAETARIEGQGRGLLSTLFPNVERTTGRLGSAVGGSGASAGRLLALLAPLVLGLIGRRAAKERLDAAALSHLLGSLSGGLEGMLPPGMTALAPLLAPVTTETGVAATPTVTRAVPTPPAPTTTPVTPPTTTTVTTTIGERRRGFPWWLIPLLLLLGLGGCWLLQPRPGTAPTGGTTTTSPVGAGLQINRPASGATLPADGFVIDGIGPAGDTLRIEEGGQEIASVTVSPDGTWEAAIPAPAPGEHTYTVSGGGDARSEVKVNVLGDGTAAPAARTPDSTARDGGATAGAATDTASGSVSGNTTNGTVQTFAVTEPPADAQLPAGTFTLGGTGTPGETLQVFEDDTSLGNVTVAGDGTWSLEVPSPVAGPHTYRVQGAGGSDLGQVTVNVAASAPGASAAACTRDYTLSITDGQTVSEPFRFGGEGQGEGYRVTVRRGDRVIGTRTMRLDATCGWSYQSKPGPGDVTYEVRSLGQAEAEPLSSVTLTVRE